MAQAVIPEIIEQYAEDAAFLWMQRNRVVSAFDYFLEDINTLDCRIDAILNALMIAGDEGWEISKTALRCRAPEEIFVLSILAASGSDETRMQFVLEKADGSPELSCGVVLALGWLPYDQVKDHITKLLSSKSANLFRIGIAACAAHRQYPGNPLIHAIYARDTALISRALLAVGELGKTDMMTTLIKHKTHDDAEIRFAAAWSAGLLGQTDAAIILADLAKQDLPCRKEALQLAMRICDPEATLQLQNHLACKNETLRLAVMSAGIIGKKYMMEWLISHMRHPELARFAGACFAMVTGVDLARAKLIGARPENFQSGPTDDPQDNNVLMDPDDALPWPDHKLVESWWATNQSKYKDGVRYLMGQQINIAHLKQVLSTGNQPTRKAAALELAIANPGKPLFDIDAPSWRQKEALRTL